MDGRGAILDVAREVSALLREAGIPGMVIGGVAVVLHGHVRTTLDVDIFVAEPPARLAALLISRGFVHDPSRAEFSRDGIPVHLVLADQVGAMSHVAEEIEGVLTIGLADLVSMKLRSGTGNILRAQDLADVIGLIRRRGLTGGFARFVAKDVRPEFRRLARAVGRDPGQPASPSL